MSALHDKETVSVRASVYPYPRNACRKWRCAVEFDCIGERETERLVACHLDTEIVNVPARTGYRSLPWPAADAHCAAA